MTDTNKKSAKPQYRNSPIAPDDLRPNMKVMVHTFHNEVKRVDYQRDSESKLSVAAKIEIESGSRGGQHKIMRIVSLNLPFVLVEYKLYSHQGDYIREVKDTRNLVFMGISPSFRRAVETGPKKKNKKA